MDAFFAVLDAINGVLLSVPVLLALLGIGLLFTLWSGFCQYRSLTHGVALVAGKGIDTSHGPGALTHFQALTAAMSGTVGLGAIAGMAIAVDFGGPGAVFWMWVVGLVGTGGEDVDGGQGVRVRRVVLRDRVGELQAGLLDEVVVDDGGGDVVERRGGHVGVQGRHLHARGAGVDVGDVGEDRAAVLERDESGRLQHEQATGLVAGVVRHGDGRVVGDVGHVGVLLGVQAERVDGRGADRHEVLVVRDVVVGEVDDVLELVEVQVALGDGGVRLGVVGEVDDVDVETGLLGGLLVLGPVGVAGADDADPPGLGVAGGLVGTATGGEEDDDGGDDDDERDDDRDEAAATLRGLDDGGGLGHDELLPAG